MGDMQTIEQLKQEARLAREELSQQIHSTEHSINETYQRVSDSIDSVKSKLNLRKHFKKNFWLTTGVLVGTGIIVGRMGGSKSVRLSEAQLKELVKQISSRVAAEQSPEKEPSYKNTVGTSLLGTLAKPHIIMGALSMVSTLASQLKDGQEISGDEVTGDGQAIH